MHFDTKNYLKSNRYHIAKYKALMCLYILKKHRKQVQRGSMATMYIKCMMS